MNFKTLTSIALGFAALALAEGESYTWPTYSSKLNYNFKDQGATYAKPTKHVSGTCYNAAKNANGVYEGEYWAFYHGANKNSLVTETAIKNLLTRFDTDFTYITDSLGWPRDARVKDGYYSAVYLYGSDACTGSNDPNETGGWQSFIDGYPAVAASYYPVYSFDPACTYRDKESQMSAMIHEGIHAILTNLGAAHVHWFQEGGNTWLQQEMEVRRGNQSEYGGMGFLNAGNLMAPFVPIESYSGWLLDGTFGGPGAQGVDAGGNCNWRNTLGGVQYGNLFPTFLGLWVAQGAVPWIWVNIPNNNGKYILESMAAAVGEEEVRSIIMEYRAKLAMLDMKKWSNEMKNLLNQNVGGSIKCEYTPCANTVDAWYVTPYVQTTNNNGVLTPEERTTPGWTGANVIPLTVASGAKTVKLSLQEGWTTKTGTAASTGNGAKLVGDLTDMYLQIAYRATDGTPIYSIPAKGKTQAVLNLDKAPASGVVFAIVSNTTYKSARENHYTYKLKLDEGVSGAADYKTKWYEKFNLNYDWDNAKNVTGGSSSSVGGVSSSSVGGVSSSSIGGVSSSSKETVGSTTTINAKITLPINDDYASVSFDLKLSDAAKVLGLSVAEIASKATYFAMDGNNEDSNSTANAPGHWFNDKGAVTSYDNDNATLYSEFNIAEGKAFVGHYPNRVSNGDTYSFIQGLKYNGNKVFYKVTVTLTNSGKDNSEKTTLAQFNRNRPATHITLLAQNGKVTLGYTLDRMDRVKINLYTGFGGLLYSDISRTLPAGSYYKEFDMNQMRLPSGTYLVKVSTGAYNETRSITIAK